MKKIAVMFLFSVALLASECSYEMKIWLKNGSVFGEAKIDFDGVLPLESSQSEILSVEGATLAIEKSVKLKKTSKEPVKILFKSRAKNVMGTLLLMEGWYPTPEPRCRYTLEADLKNLTPITQYTRKMGNRFIFDAPLKRVFLVASGDYVVKEGGKRVKIGTYLYPKDAGLADRYIRKSLRLFEMYEKIFGFVPYKNFNVVEVPFPAGYSMATMSMIGEPIIEKDFVFEYSLGHEIVHQWFGNYLFSVPKGNWAEGLSTYYSDMLFASRKGEGARYRKDLMIKYDSYVKDRNEEITLDQFRYKSYEDKNAIGYGKSAMFFYMLSEKITPQKFDEAIKALLKRYPYKEISYEELKKSFEETASADLSRFFKDWVYKKGAFDFHLQNIEVTFKEEKFVTSFELLSNDYDLELPVEICNGDRCESFTIDTKQKRHSLYTDFAPKEIVVDPDYKIFRRLQPAEIPPVISEILGSDNLIAVCDEKDKFAPMLKGFSKVVSSKELDFEDMRKADIVLFGKSDFLKRFAIDFRLEGDAKVEVYKNPLNTSRYLMVFDGERALYRSFRLLSHLGRYSVVVFEGREFKRYTKPSQKGAKYIVDAATSIVKVDVRDDFEALIDKIEDSRAIFVGEQHTKYANHVNQLRIIKALKERGKDLAIGMEMFQKPYQKYLDQYIAGEIDEKEMLEKTEYLKRWKYDYALYRPILRYAKKEKIKIVALNIPREISNKVAKKGIDSLTKKEAAQLPDSMDFTNLVYEEYMRMIFEAHAKKSFKNFENFYYAQVLWDETMAQGVAEYLKRNPKKQMVVLAGNGHLRFGYGIPDRVKRRGIDSYKIVLQNDKLKPKIADFILYPPPMDPPSTRRLGVLLKGEKDLRIEEVKKNTPAERAGLKKGDLILSVGSVKVSDVSRLKMELLFADRCFDLKIERKDKELEKEICFEEQ